MNSKTSGIHIAIPTVYAAKRQVSGDLSPRHLPILLLDQICRIT